MADYIEGNQSIIAPLFALAVKLKSLSTHLIHPFVVIGISRQVVFCVERFLCHLRLKDNLRKKIKAVFEHYMVGLLVKEAKIDKGELPKGGFVGNPTWD